MDERLADTGWQADFTLFEAAKKLGNEERVATGPFVQRVRISGGHSRTDGKFVDFVGREARQVDAGHSRMASQRHEEPYQRMRSRDLAGAIGPHHQQTTAVGVGQMSEQRQRRPVRPMQIVGDQDQRDLVAQVGQQGRDGTKQPRRICSRDGAGAFVGGRNVAKKFRRDRGDVGSTLRDVGFQERQRSRREEAGASV